MTALKGRVRPLRIHVPDDDLQTTRIRGIGFEATCECREKSPRCASWAMARGWLREHRRSCKPSPAGETAA